MIFYSVVTPTRVTKDNIDELVRSWDGKWLDAETSNEEDGNGVINPLDRDPATIYVHFTSDLSADFSEDDLEDLRRIFRAEPKTNILLGVSHHRGSSELARDFAKYVIDRFGGIYNYETKD